jgi:hypothetical protein
MQIIRRIWKNARDNWAACLLVGGLIVMVIGLAHQKIRNNYIDNIVKGEIRGNRQTKIFHLAKCPNYDEIEINNLVKFESVQQAETKGYRFAKNCSEEILSIKRINETEINDYQETPLEDPRQ